MTALNYADKIYHGSQLAAAAYLGAAKVWSFKPTDYSGCAIWLDATTLSLANGAAVTAWTNLGSGSQPTIVGTPTFRTNALNAKPVVRIVRGASRVKWNSGTGVDKNWTLIYVGRRWQIGAGRVITASMTAANLLVGFHGNEMDQAYIEGWLTSGTAPRTTTQWKLYSADSTATGLASFYVNGVFNSKGSGTPANGWGETFYISGYSDDADAGVSQQADCEIAEVVLYNRQLTTAERQTVEGYLRAKWNPVTPFKPTDFGTDLLAWFDGADPATVQITGSGVSQWTNKGTGAMTLVQATDANRPTYVNGAVQFVTPQILIPANAPAAFDVVFVSKPNVAGDWRTLLRSATAHEIIIESTTTRLGAYSVGFLPAGGLTWGNVEGIGYARITASAAVLLSRDGGALTTTTTALGAGSPSPIMFGAYGGPPPSQAWGSIKEIIFMPYNLDSARQLLEGYLAHKWGLAALLPSTHPYKSIKP